jgi:hypothetical protein
MVVTRHIINIFYNAVYSTNCQIDLYSKESGACRRF